MAEYKLLKDLPGYKAGYIFEDNTGYPFDGFNKLAYPDWFEEIKVEVKEFDRNDMLDFAKQVYMKLQTVPTFCPDNWLKGQLNKYLRQYRR